MNIRLKVISGFGLTSILAALVMLSVFWPFTFALLLNICD